MLLEMGVSDRNGGVGLSHGVRGRQGIFRRTQLW